MINLPAKIKKEFDIKVGDEVSFIKTDEGYLLIPVKDPLDLIRSDEMDIAKQAILDLKKDHMQERQTIKKYLFDTGAITLFYADHSEVKKYYIEVQNSQAIGIVPKLILTEYYYKTWQFFGKQAAELRTNSFKNSKVRVCDMTDDDIFNAGKYKVRNTLLSIADCVAISCAVREGALILTTEDEMSSVKTAKVRKINY